MQFHSQRILVIGIADREASTAHGVVKAAHMPADGNRFSGFQPKKTFNQINAFLSMPIGKGVLYCKIGNFLPLPGSVVFYVPKACFIVVCFAQVMKKRNDCIGFQTVLFCVKISFGENMIYVQTVHHKAGFTGPMEPGRGGGSVEIGRCQPVQKFIRAGPRHVFGEDPDKFCFVIHNQISSSFRMPFKMAISS